MSTLTIDLFSSLDGYGAAEGWPGYWGKEGPELLAWLEEQLAEDHTIVMRGNTYRTMSRIVAEEKIHVRPDGGNPEIVFSKTLTPTDVGQHAGPQRGARRRAAADEGRGRCSDRTLGSISLNKSLLQEGIVDLLQMVSFPLSPGRRAATPSMRTGPTWIWSPSRRDVRRANATRTVRAQAALTSAEMIP